MPAVLKLWVCTDEVRLRVERVVQTIDALIAEADVAAQIPAAEILDHRAAHTRGGAIAMSAANAAWDNKVAAPAAMKDLTLRMGFVLLSGEADCNEPHFKNSRTDDGIKCLSGA